MENKSIQDILDVDVGAIIDQGKKAKKRRKQMLLGGVIGIVLTCSLFWFAQTKDIYEVEAAIENIEIENLSSVTHARELYDAINDIIKWRVSNTQKLVEAEKEVEIKAKNEAEEAKRNAQYLFDAIIQAWESPAMQGVPKIKQILENLNDSTKNTLQEMLIESNKIPRNTILEIFDS